MLRLAKPLNARSRVCIIRSDFHLNARRSFSTMEPSKTSPQNWQQNVVVNKENDVTLIGINRPKVMNAINRCTSLELCEAIREFEDDKNSQVAVLYGVGKSFCAGYDIMELGKDNGEQVCIRMLLTPEGTVGPTRRHLQKPIVCAINGYCIANGLELALTCDFRIMEEDAILGFFNRGLGVPIMDGGTVRLPAMIGLSRALDMILTGRKVCANEAYQIGLVHRIVPKGKALYNAIDLAKTLAELPQAALKHDRDSIYTSKFNAQDFKESIETEIIYSSREAIDDMQQGMAWYFQTTLSYFVDLRKKLYERFKTHLDLESLIDWADKNLAMAIEALVKEKKVQEKERIEAENKAKEENTPATKK